jgi:hypothetical protein
MNKTFFKKVSLSSTLCIAMTSFLLLFAVTSYGEDVLEPCPIPMTVEVSPYQVNIDSGGVSHDVRILTYSSYSNTKGAFVYINDNDYPIDSEYVKLTRDSVGHLVVKIDLDALQDAGLAAEMFHYLTIVAELKKAVDGCIEKEGVGEMYVIGKKGA